MPSPDLASSSKDAEISQAAVTERESKEEHSGEEEKMDIHPPHRPIHSKRDFLLHMLTIVLGILIALGLESLIEWGHHRALVREAREHIAAEIRQNKETIDQALPEILKRQDDLNHVIAVVQEIEHTHKVPPGPATYNWSHYTIYSAAWQTAVTSGAATYMNYAELRRYNDLYDGQQSFTSLQDDAFKAVANLSELAILRKDVKDVRVERFENIERDAYRALEVNKGLANVGRDLSLEYGKFLQEK